MGADITKPSSSSKRPQIIGVRYVRRPFTKKRRIIFIVLAVAAVVALCTGIWYKWGYSSQAFINGGKYQAVFTTNNQAYFGKLQRLSDGAYRLSNVYYLQQSGNTAQKPDSTGQTPQLVKMGSELHGPEDAIVFPPEQVLFWENLKSDGKVAKAIDDYAKK
jgi:hypothetical protein